MQLQQTDLATFLNHNARRLAAFLHRCHSVKPSDVDDYLQELWLKLNGVEIEYEGDDQLRAYCFATLRSLVAERLRKIEPGRETYSCEVAEDSVANAEDRKASHHEMHEALHESLQELDKRSRSILYAYHMEGKKTHEIAHEFNLEQDNVRKILSRARKELRKDSDLQSQWEALQ